MSLFHVAPIRLAPGSVVLPGNWGRIIRAVGQQHNRWQREQLLEAARQARFPNHPSRLEAAFACATEDGAHLFHRVQVNGGNMPGVIYEVEKVEPDAPQHLAEFNLAILTPAGMSDNEAIEHYWHGDFWFNIADGPHPGFRCEEVVTTSPLRIVREI